MAISKVFFPYQSGLSLAIFHVMSSLRVKTLTAVNDESEYKKLDLFADENHAIPLDQYQCLESDYKTIFEIAKLTHCDAVVLDEVNHNDFAIVSDLSKEFDIYILITSLSDLTDKDFSLISPIYNRNYRLNSFEIGNDESICIFSLDESYDSDSIKELDTEYIRVLSYFKKPNDIDINPVPLFCAESLFDFCKTFVHKTPLSSTTLTDPFIITLSSKTQLKHNLCNKVPSFYDINIQLVELDSVDILSMKAKNLKYAASLLSRFIYELFKINPSTTLLHFISLLIQLTDIEIDEVDSEFSIESINEYNPYLNKIFPEVKALTAYLYENDLDE